MSALREAAQQALEALEHATPTTDWSYMITALRAALAQRANHLTIERLRDALVASRIIDPAAVEDPDGYDDGVTLHRIEALHRRIA